jgi:hypothetical protein
MNGHQHYAEGEHELALADTKPTYSEAAGQHVARAAAHFAAALAWSALRTWSPEELSEGGCESPGCSPHLPCSPECEASYDMPLPVEFGPLDVLCDGSCGERAPHAIHTEPTP